METTVNKFIADACLTLGVKQIPARTDGNMGDMPAGSRHYEMKLKSPILGIFKFQYSAGPGHDVKTSDNLAEVLECLSSDLNLGDYTPDSFLSEFGYDATVENFRLAERCIEFGKKLQQYFGEFYSEKLGLVSW